MTERAATGLIKFALSKLGYVAWTSPWHIIYVMPGWERQEWLMRHERAHLAQMKRDGSIVFMVRYAYWHLRYGYRNNPYEIEARAHEYAQN